MPRRPHRKSRSGCLRCKKRHIKASYGHEHFCDERRPRCVNCQTAGLDCAFAPNTSAPTTPSVETETAGPSISETSTPGQQRQGHGQFNVTPTFSPSETSDAVLNMKHLELLHQFVTSTYRTFNDNNEVGEVWRTSVVRMALGHPYLMYELLAISALHLAYCRPESSPWYYTTSTELQTQALNSFNSIQREVDASNCGPVLMFTSLLAVHVLADPSRTVGLGMNQYLDHVIHCIMLMRNVQKLVIQDWYEDLKNSELGPIFGVTQPEKPYQIPRQCLDLAKLTESSDLGEQAKETYNSAIDRLHWLYAVSNVPNETYNTVRWLLAWPIQLNGDYQDKLNQRRPEALVILAYFAVMLRFYKDCWVVGDSGKFLIESISAHLGPHWGEWMEWPLSFLADAGDTG
ncbi:hypothetical protein A1O7_03364 [Cladophialophora yegresii CBS 114405]|uniref:Zn(2)-C6 fungal-type domain-containing protein n=1 Tax=Cladophialophora yegresii CBS 114405 TaxID=1182544 RepID=W9WED0_9EURO|nr:uncharacterized protein A1O7_03364 [Cladophialophora yegresii CBS 114405]EXJ62921.1 hypothetical protein A1O7_03364 [Cladophialophora yegresii CBS 114405]